jgi:hypothetical protein
MVDLLEIMVEMEKIFAAAEMFVSKHFKTVDDKDKGIKILATMNQMIELKKLAQKGQ